MSEVPNTRPLWLFSPFSCNVNAKDRNSAYLDNLIKLNVIKIIFPLLSLD